MTREFQGAATGSASGFFGSVVAQYKNNQGYLEIDKYIAILDGNAGNETHYKIFQLGKHTAFNSSFWVAINSSSGAAYVHKMDKELPQKVAERFVNMITGNEVDYVTQNEDWFEFFIRPTEYRGCL